MSEDEENRDEEIASPKDRVRYTDVWITIIEKAALALAEGNTLLFYSYVDTLILTLYKELRNEVVIKLNELKQEKDLFTAYRETYSYAIGVIDRGGYLRKMDKVEEGRE